MVTSTFTKKTTLPVSCEELYQWHARPGALDRLLPPWEHIEVTERADSIEPGSRVILTNKVGPFRLRWVAEHTGCRPGQEFSDVQRSGPFKSWEHLHRFHSKPNGSELEDRVEYQLPGGFWGDMLGGGYIRRKLEAMFRFRHCRTRDETMLHHRYRDQGPLHVAVTGSSGLLGREIGSLLTTGGHRLTRLVRSSPQAGELLWRPEDDENDLRALEGVDAVVHLAGESIAGRRWSPQVKAEIRSSRVEGTRNLALALARLSRPPRVLVSASAIGVYGDRGKEALDESAVLGDGFLAEVGRDWEEATIPAQRAGMRVVHARFGLVLSPRDGALRVRCARLSVEWVGRFPRAHSIGVGFPWMTLPVRFTMRFIMTN